LEKTCNVCSALKKVLQYYMN